MHGITHVKIINAKQATTYNRYKNTKEKLLKTNAAIWFNKMCRTQHLCPQYINIKVNVTANITENARNNTRKEHIYTY
jgi:hypothetical protein